jgi:chaperonin GroEL (HSP60 family)
MCAVYIGHGEQAAVEEGIVVGGGCALLRLSSKVDAIKDTLENYEQKVGADIVKRALSYPIKLIAKNAGVNGSMVVEKVDNFTLKSFVGFSVPCPFKVIENCV